MNTALNGSKYRLILSAAFIALAFWVASCMNPVHAAPAAPTAPTNELFPDNVMEAAAMYGVPGERSADSAQWNPIEGGFTLLFGESTKVNVRNNCAYGRYYDGNNHDFYGPVEFTAEQASFYRNWTDCPDPVTSTPTPTTTPIPPTATPYPEVPVGPALTSWPATAADAAWAFSAKDMQTIVEEEVKPCNNGAGDCWLLQFADVRPVSIPRGAKGQISETEFVTEKGLWVKQITVWRDWDVLPVEPTHPDLLTGIWLGTWPTTAEEAANVFSPEGGPALDPSAFSRCDGGIGECWLVQLTEPAYVLLPHGALGQITETQYKTGVATWVSQVTIRHDWEAYKKLPPQNYLPLLFK
jgi:hypothetical protein